MTGWTIPFSRSCTRHDAATTARTRSDRSAGGVPAPDARQCAPTRGPVVRPAPAGAAAARHVPAAAAAPVLLPAAAAARVGRVPHAVYDRARAVADRVAGAEPRLRRPRHLRRPLRQRADD